MPNEAAGGPRMRFLDIKVFGYLYRGRGANFRILGRYRGIYEDEEGAVCAAPLWYNRGAAGSPSGCRWLGWGVLDPSPFGG